MKKIIINADDYGLSSLFNKGILELATTKKISSVSAMVTKKFSLSAIDLNNVSIGLHLKIKERDTLKEMKKQLMLFRRLFKKLPSHLDGHQHQHLTKYNLPKVIKLARKYGLPIRSRFSADRKMLRRFKIKTPDNFISWHPKRIKDLENKLKNADGSVVELVCHPGYYDKSFKSGYNQHRKEELKFLKSRRFKKLIDQFKIIRYDEF